MSKQRTPEEEKKHCFEQRTKYQKGQSNRDYAEKNGAFRHACDEAGVKYTKRQASKFRNKRGAAYNAAS